MNMLVSTTKLNKFVKNVMFHAWNVQTLEKIIALNVKGFQPFYI